MSRRRPSKGRAGKIALVAVLLTALALAAYVWWLAQRWVPDPSAYSEQGAFVDEGAGAVNFRTLRALGAGFVYVAASEGAEGRNPTFTENFEAADEIGLSLGVVHRFDPCVAADRQTANLVVMVPRDADLLPVAVALEDSHAGCEARHSEAWVESELLTFINQVENHTGRPVILKPSRAFEREYGFASRIERNLWLTQSWAEPTYGGRPWLLWTANRHRTIPASERPVAWVVARP